jgi:hypothetical protein
LVRDQRHAAKGIGEAPMFLKKTALGLKQHDIMANAKL